MDHGPWTMAGGRTGDALTAGCKLPQLPRPPGSIKSTRYIGLLDPKSIESGPDLGITAGRRIRITLCFVRVRSSLLEETGL
jgi:hypothetical protein